MMLSARLVLSQHRFVGTGFSCRQAQISLKRAFPVATTTLSCPRQFSSAPLALHSHSHSGPGSHSHAHSHSHGAEPEDDHIHLKASETETNDEIIFGVKGKHFEYINGSGNDSPSTSVQNEKLIDSFEQKGLNNSNLKSISSSKEPESTKSSHGHSHFGGAGHTHTHSSELLQDLSIKKAMSNPGAQITVIGLITNIGMAVAKGFGGLIFHSQALVADAVHSISDLVSDFLTLFTISFSSKQPNSLFPNGYGKIESLGSLSVSSLLLVAGVSIGYSSLVLILGPLIPASIYEVIHHYQEVLHIHDAFGNDGHSHAHSHVHATDINAAWIAAGSIAVKEWLFQATKKIAVKQNSNVLLANAWHHRVDSLTSIAALISITGGIYFNVSWLDPLGGLIVSSLIVKAGYGGVKSAVFELVDRAIPLTDERYIEVEKDINDVLSKLLSNNNARRPYTIVELSLMSSGPNYVINNLRLAAPKQKWENVLSINEFEAVTRILKEKLFDARPNLKKISVEFVEEEEQVTPLE